MAERRIYGQVERVTGTHVQGWIVDTQAKGALVPFTVRAPTGDERQFVTFIPRPDLCEKFGADGRFGFAIPLFLLSGLKGELTLRGPAGEILDGCSFSLPAASSFECKQPGVRHIFLHIQKTAGTSIRSALQRAVPPGQSLPVYTEKFGVSLPEFAAMPAPQRSGFRFTFGHFYFGLHRWIAAPARYITVLRDPIERIRSHYWNYRRSGLTLFVNGKHLPLSEVVNQALTDEFDNLQTRMIAGLYPHICPIGKVAPIHVATAIVCLQKHFDFVGLHDNLNQDWPMLVNTLGLADLSLPRLNKTDLTIVNRDDPDYWRIDWERVKANNKFDIALYQFIKERRRARPEPAPMFS